MTPAASRSPDLAEVVDPTSLLPNDRLAHYSVDGVAPSAVAAPRSVAELSALLRAASNQGLRVVPWGGGTQMGLGNTPSSIDLVIELAALDGLLAHEAADLTVSVAAGMTLASLQERLAKQGQYLPLQAPMPHRCTIGGCLATAASGPWRLAHGGPRDWLIGSSVVLADGVQVKSGGQVVKNVTGYDLNKLYVGSLGTLAVIVGATFKVAPIPPRAATLAASFASVDQALDASRQLLSLSYGPRALQVVSGGLGQWLPQLAPGNDDVAYLLAEHAGGPKAVEAKLAETGRLLTQYGALSVQESSDGDPSDADRWQSVTDLGWANPHPGDILLRAMTQPSRLPSLIDAALRGVHPPGRIAADPGYGLLRMLWPGDHEAPPLNEALSLDEALSPREALSLGDMPVLISGLRAYAVSLGGHLVVERCPLPIKEQTDVWGEVEGIALMRRIKEKLDPKKILNTGRFVAGI